jgi:hypothetical protein
MTPTKTKPLGSHLEVSKRSEEPDNFYPNNSMMTPQPSEMIELADGVFFDPLWAPDLSKFGNVAVDAEWYGKKFLSKQFTFMDKDLNPIYTIVPWDQDRPGPTRIPRDVKVICCDIQNTVLADVCKLAKGLDCYIYYSPRDVEAMVGREVWREVLLAKDRPIKKLRNLTGRFIYRETTYVLKDCVGAFNTSLENAMLSVGVDNPYKKLPDVYTKDRMDLFMEGDPNAFLEYAVGDTVYLGPTMTARIKQVNQIISEALGPNVISYDVKTFPRSSGSLVSKTFQAWLRATYPEMMRLVLQITDSNNDEAWEKLRKLKDTLKTGGDLVEIDRKMTKEDGFVHGLAMGSIRSFGLLSQNTGLYGAVVMGGRCVNEEPHQNPYQNRIKNVVDIDLSSCYGSALKDFDYPIGIPTIWENHRDDRPVTLRTFLKKHREQLVDGLYTIYVKGFLGFEQDLVHSKYGLSTGTIQKTIISQNFGDKGIQDVWDREIETAHLGGEFLLTKKQIENGIITSEVWKVLESVASVSEMSGLLDLEVVAAIYYPKDLELSVDAWSSRDPESLGGHYRRQADTRSRQWCRVKLKGFIDNFIQYRKKVKKQSQEKGDQADLLQNAVKLFVNTTYGDLAAPYFPMGNTVLANNITAKARTGVWMLSKALLTVQSITDGGMFSWDRVLGLKTGEKKPGLHVLSDRQRLLEHRGTYTKKLTDRDVWQWMKESSKSEGKELDRICLDHIDGFWETYGLKLPFAIECKYENTAREAVYFGSSDYLLSECIDGKAEKIKCRGAKEYDHPKKQWLRYLLRPQENQLPSPFFAYRELIGVTDYQKAGGKGYGDLLPGMDINLETWHRPYTNGEIYPTYADYQRTQESKEKAVRRHKLSTKEVDEVSKNTCFFGLASKVKQGKFSPV